MNDLREMINAKEPVDPVTRLSERMAAMPQEHREIMSKIVLETAESIGGTLDEVSAAKIERAMDRAQETINNDARFNTYKRQLTSMTPADIAFLESRYLRELAGFGGKLEAAKGIVLKYKRLGLNDASIYDLNRITEEIE